MEAAALPAYAGYEDPIQPTLPILLEDDQMGPWAFKQYTDKYSWKDDEGNPIEIWPDTSYRTVRYVLGALGYTDSDYEFQALVRYISQRKFIPGGRYLASAGRQIHQTNNCFLYRCDDSREGWAELVRKSIMGLSSGGGIGVVYSDVRANGEPIKKTGGTATGPLSPANMVNEIARHVMQGGHRRSAIWGGLHWNHKDVFDWIRAKDWSPELKAAKEKDFHSPAPMDMTNISVILDSEFFLAYENPTHSKHEWAHKVYWDALASMVANGEPGFSIDVGQNAKENLRNAPVTADTKVLTFYGYRRVGDIVDRDHTIWTGKQWAPKVRFEKTQENAPIIAVEMTGGRVIRCDPTHEFLVERYEGAGERRKFREIERISAKDLEVGDQLHLSLPYTEYSQNFDSDAYTLGYIYGDGSFNGQGGADLTLCSDESKGCLEYLTGYNSVNENESRGFTRLYFSNNNGWKDNSKDQFPDFQVHSDDHRNIRSFLAGLFDADGNWEPKQKRIRLASIHEGFLRDTARVLEQLGILAHVTKAGHSTYGKSQTYQLVVAADSNSRFADFIPTKRMHPSHEYKPYRQQYVKVTSVFEDGLEDVYCADVSQPEHSFQAEGVIISNCTEITSEDDSDVCNLGSINLARIENPEELAEITRLAMLFLIAGTVYSDIPHEEVRAVREKNRRTGLGLMGVHEWLLVRGHRYEMNDEFREWLQIWKDESDAAAEEWSAKHNLSVPLKKRAIAPNGTIGIIGETTTSAEPIFCVAYKRRFLDNDRVWRYQYVIDPTAHYLIEERGVDPDSIEDAYSLSYNVERRIKFQADLQEYVDHGISSTINLPYSIVDPEEVRDFGETLMTYLPKLRGVTCYPDGARAGQPLEAVPYLVAKGKTGVTMEEDTGRDAQCHSGICGV